MTALAAIARLVLAAVLGAVLLAAVVGAVLWAQYGPQGWPLAAWLLAVCAVVVGAGLGVSALHPARAAVQLPCSCRCPCLAPGRRDDDGAPGWCDPCRMNIHQEA